MNKRLIKIATRKSPMALWQAQYVAEKLKKKYPDLQIELLGFVTQGDRDLDQPLNAVGGKSLFVKELQQALLRKEADLAVHSIKDMSVMEIPELKLSAVCERHDPRDAFVSFRYAHFSELPPGAVIGSSSPRRQAQLLALRPDLNIKLLRGNVNSRLLKLEKGEYDAVILAAAGLMRLNQMDKIRHYFELEEMLPCIGQGALGMECHADNAEIIKITQALNHIPSQICVLAERAVNRRLGGDCYTPIAAHAFIKDKTLHLQALVSSLDGKKILKSVKAGSIQENESLGLQVAEDLLSQGAAQLLNPTHP